MVFWLVPLFAGILANIPAFLILLAGLLGSAWFTGSFLLQPIVFAFAIGLALMTLYASVKIQSSGEFDRDKAIWATIIFVLFLGIAFNLNSIFHAAGLKSVSAVSFSVAPAPPTVFQQVNDVGSYFFELAKPYLWVISVLMLAAFIGFASLNKSQQKRVF